MVETVRAAFFDLGRGPRSERCQEALREAAARHRSAGDLVVVVGPEAEIPLLADSLGLDADQVLHTDHPPDNDHCPASVVETITLLGLDAARCFGYVDHAEGLRTLCVVGNPRVVGIDPDLCSQAESRGWPQLEESLPSAPAGSS
jgi:hypothetical protein